MVQEQYPGLIAIGGNLQPQNLVRAYKKGLFPWFSAEEPIMWWSLDPRMVLNPGDVRIQKDVKRLLRKPNITVRLNHNPEAVISACAKQPRPGQDGTWITPAIVQSYTQLAKSNIAWCLGLWKEDQLVSGLYGVKLGKMFFGESMFSRIPNGSKALLVWLCTHWNREIALIDCQQETDHLKFMGAKSVDRTWFLQQVAQLTANKKPAQP